MKDILNTFGKIKKIEHDKNTIYQNNEFNQCGLFMDYAAVSIDDEFQCIYKDVKFNIYEIELHIDTNTTLFNTFKGIIIDFKHNKKVKSKTIVTTKRNQTKNHNIVNLIVFIPICIFVILVIKAQIDSYFENGYFFNNFYTFFLWCIGIIPATLIGIYALRSYIRQRSTDKITLEDPKFNKRFDVYSSDEVEARYIVTPLFMELLNNLKTAFGTKELKCSFYDNSFMIAIPTKRDVFEIGDINVPCTDPKFILQFWRELSSIYKMIEYFRLNERLYS